MPCDDLFVAAHRGGEFRAQGSVAGLAKFELQAHTLRDLARVGLRMRIGRLRQVNQLAVIAEIRREQLRMPVESEALNHQAVEMSQQKIRQVKGSRFGLGQRGEHGAGGKKSKEGAAR